MGKYDEAVYRILSDPVTPNEVAKKLGLTQKTAQRVLMHLALTREDVKYRNSGRIHIFWKTSNPPEVKNMVIPKDKIGTTRVILDGQQRLTTLYLFIKNGIPPYYQKHEIRNDPRNLYFNLETGEFQYYQPSRMKDNPVWVSVIKRFDKEEKIDVFTVAKERINSFMSESDLDKHRFHLANTLNDNLNQLRNIPERNYPVQFVPTSANIDEAIDVFDRVNSLGTKLTDADLALAHICGKWPQARRVMKKKIEEYAKHSFYFDLGFMVRCLTGIAKGRALFEMIHQSSRDELENGWERLSRVLDYLINILRTHANIHSTEDLNTKKRSGSRGCLFGQKWNVF